MRISGDSIEGQSASRPVQIHGYLVGVFLLWRYLSASVIVPQMLYHSNVSTVRKTPGLVIPPKFTFTTFSPPADSLVRYTKIKLPLSLHLPVTTTSQTICAENLLEAVKSLWMVSVRLLLLLKCHLSVVLRQDEASVCCVGVQCELAGI